jgi:RNA polymerase sigma-70 factor (ECF subfamily)
VTQDVLIKLFRHLPAFNYDRQKGAFRAWLKTITRHALSDYQESQKHAGIGSGDTGVFERLQTLVAREELVKELEAAFDLELLEEARRRVQLQVTPRDWKIFTDLTVLGQSGPVVAAELQMTVTAVLMVKSRVQKKLRNEVRQLEGPSPEVTETTP